MPRWLQWTLAVLIVAIIVVPPVIHYRSLYAHSKRLRAVDPGRVYRSGQMTAEGFEEAIRELGIRTVVNLQDDYPNPDLKKSYLDRATVKERQFCEKLGVNYRFIAPDLLPRKETPARRPRAIEEMLAVFDEPNNYPILIHCKAGLHRTGCMSAIYRMEYQDWTPEQAVDEMKEHGFGDKECTAANDYVYQYVLSYRPGLRYPTADAEPRPARTARGKTAP